ncbi:MAG: hypothetical protein H6742_10205 [Alphaproteobacteria bacterium]|nr:hypothetical protein [Alphaproteobacteria bacterium]
MVALWWAVLACSAPPSGGRDSQPAADGEAAGDSGATEETTPSQAGTYRVAVREQALASGDLRASAVAWDPASQRWVVAWGAVDGAHQIQAAVVHPAEGASSLTVSPSVRLDDGAWNAFEPGLAASEDGTLLVVYEDDRAGAGEGRREIYGQRLRVGGETLEQLGGDLDISLHDPIEQFTPAVAWESGSWFVAYSDDRDNTGGDERRLFGRTVSAEGSLGAEQRLGGDSLWQVLPSVAGSGGEGRFLVVWGDYDPVGGGQGSGLDCGYRARLLDASGTPLGPPIDLARIGDVPYDRPAVAWNPRARAWLVAWTHPQRILGSWVGWDGEVLDSGFELAAPDVGAGAPQLAYAASTHSFALTFHAWTTTDGYLQELDDAGVPVGAPVDLSDRSPPVGTFYTPVAAASDRSQLLVAPSLDWSRVTGTLFVGP